jgi:hypothetical protein
VAIEDILRTKKLWMGVGSFLDATFKNSALCVASVSYVNDAGKVSRWEVWTSPLCGEDGSRRASYCRCATQESLNGEWSLRLLRIVVDLIDGR